MLHGDRGLSHKPGNRTSTLWSHTRVKRSDSTRMSPDLHTCSVPCAPHSIMHVHSELQAQSLKEFYFLNVWKYLMLPITEKLKCRVERREEMNSNRTVSYYAGLRNTRMPVNINLWPANSLKILNSHRKSFP